MGRGKEPPLTLAGDTLYFGVLYLEGRVGKVNDKVNDIFVKEAWRFGSFGTFDPLLKLPVRVNQKGTIG